MPPLGLLETLIPASLTLDDFQHRAHGNQPRDILVQYLIMTARSVRVTVGMIVEAIAAGRSVPDLQNDFPYLEEGDIREAVVFAEAPGNR
ncbi:MAG TPA: DUF433 domain-containing protein [Verrucomicrobiae bacterium]|nr:DUF433 domain-containing protein [Verrucomicrobiae bacterium]